MAGQSKVDILISKIAQVTQAIYIKLDQVKKTQSFILLSFFILILLYRILSLDIPPSTDFSHDTPIHMDAVWRILQGQRPHLDFYVHSDDLYHLALAAIAKIVGFNVRIFVYFQCLMIAILSGVIWFISKSRMKPAETLFISLLTATLLAGLQLLGFKYNTVTYAGYYNKVLWAVLMILSVGLLKPSSTKSWMGRSTEGFIFGVLFAFLFGMKISYFLLAILALVLGISQKETTLLKDRIRFSFLLGGAGLGFILYGYYLHWNWIALLLDLNRVAHSYQPELIGNIDKILYVFSDLSFIIFGIVILSINSSRSREIDPLKMHHTIRSLCSRIPIWLPVIYLIVAGTVTILGNMQFEQIPLFMIAPLFIPRLEHDQKSKAAALGFSFILSFICIMSSLGSISYAHFIKTTIESVQESTHIESNTIHSTAFENWHAIVGGGKCRKFEYANRINSGMKLIETHSKAPVKIQALDYSNPFPIALAWPSPRNASIVNHLYYSFVPDTLPPPEVLFSDTDALIIPLCPEHKFASETLVNHFKEYIKTTFTERYENEDWILRFKPGKSQ